jgi:hypothetical protein
MKRSLACRLLVLDLESGRLAGNAAKPGATTRRTAVTTGPPICLERKIQRAEFRGQQTKRRIPGCFCRASSTPIRAIQLLPVKCYIRLPFLIGIPDPPPRAGDEERELKCSDAPLSVLLPTEKT